MDEPKRLLAGEVRQKVMSGEALLVCAYGNEEKFRTIHLEGAISLGDFTSRIPSLSKEQKIIFYCT